MDDCGGCRPVEICSREYFFFLSLGDSLGENTRQWSERVKLK